MDIRNCLSFTIHLICDYHICGYVCLLFCAHSRKRRWMWKMGGAMLQMSLHQICSRLGSSKHIYLQWQRKVKEDNPTVDIECANPALLVLYFSIMVSWICPKVLTASITAWFCYFPKAFELSNGWWAWFTQKAQKTKSRGPKKLQLQVGARRTSRLLVLQLYKMSRGLKDNLKMVAECG